MLPVGMGSSGSYQIDKSLRLRSGASAYLSRTLGTPTDNNRFTISMLVKRGSLGTNQTMFDAFVPATSFDCIRFNTSNQLEYFDNTAGYLTTNRLFRDPSAHMHLVVAVNTDEATAANRVKIYINGVLETSFATTNYPGLSQATKFNSAIAHDFGRFGYSNNGFFDGYISEINFIDGQALDASYFGEFNSDGVWVPKKYAGTYGTNGFYLDFKNGTSTTTLGYSAVNSNHWTLNNISLTAGATYDWMSDTPTNNYPTFNNLQSPFAGYSSPTHSNGNLKVSYNGTTQHAQCISTVKIPTSGKWYVEYFYDQVVGVLTGTSANSWGVHDGTNYCTYQLLDAQPHPSYSARVQNNGVNTAVATITTNDILAVAINTDGGQVSFYKNGTLLRTETFSTSSGNFYVIYQGDVVSAERASACSINFGQRPFAFSPPTGFKPLCTSNLP